MIYYIPKRKEIYMKKIKNAFSNIVFYTIIGLFGQWGAAFILTQIIKHMED